MQLAYYGGQEEVIDQTDDDIRTDAKRPVWIKMPFKEAISHFAQKLTIPKADLSQVDDTYHTWAFSVTGVTRGDFLDGVRFLLNEQITKGQDEKTFYRQFKRLLGRKGWKPDSHHLKMIYDTNIRGAYGAGRAQQQSHPDLLNDDMVRVWRHGDSRVPREHHLALHNKAIPVKHPFWKGGRVPGGWGCRCKTYSVSRATAQRLGIEILENPPDPETVFEPGFRAPYSTTGFTQSDRKEFLSTALGRMDPQTRKLVSDQLQSS